MEFLPGLSMGKASQVDEDFFNWVETTTSQLYLRWSKSVVLHIPSSQKNIAYPPEV